MTLILRILGLSAVVFLVSQFLPGIRLKNYTTALIVAAVYGILNYLFFYLLVILSLPVMLLTMGLFVFVINAGLLWVTDKLIADFEIKNVPTLFIAAFLITLGSWLMKWIFGI